MTFRFTRGVGIPTVNFIAPERKKEASLLFLFRSQHLRPARRGTGKMALEYGKSCSQSARQSISSVHNNYEPWKYDTSRLPREKPATACVAWHAQDLPEGKLGETWQELNEISTQISQAAQRRTWSILPFSIMGTFPILCHHPRHSSRIPSRAKELGPEQYTR
jgi:hypothetical protein